MRLGAHISASGGVFKAFKRAADVGCDSFMVYTKSNRRWQAKPLTESDIANYEREKAAYAGLSPVIVHAAYLINVASPKPDLWEKSYQALRDEVERAEALGVELMVMHPGSHMKTGEEAGLDRIVQALKRISAETPTYKLRICLETMAGQGTNLGAKFEHLAYLIAETNTPERLGVCFDTCHVFAAGYDIRTPETYAATMTEFDRVVGLDQIKCFHFNDSKQPFASRKDRHAHIGQGEIGTAAFANFTNDPQWADHAAILETAKTEKDEDGNEIDMDVVNLAVLREGIR